MKLKNSELRALNNALFSLGNHQGSIKDRWEISKMAKPISDACLLLDAEIQNLIAEKGIEENGQKVIKTNNPDYIELMNLDIDVDIQKLTLIDLEILMPTTQELVGLTPIIDGGD